MIIEDIRKKTDSELEKILQESREQLRELRFKLASRQLKNIRIIRHIKKDIARVMMVLSERKEMVK